jgi:transcriptional regulator EpsA
MTDSIIIDQVAMERILHVIEESLKVSGRSQFYVWAQGALQGLVPHATLLCVCGDLPAFRYKHDIFSGVLDEGNLIEKLTDPVDGVLNGVIESWLSAGRKPLYFAAEGAAAADDPASARLRRLGCGHALAHGAREISGGEGSFFLLLQMPQAPKSRQGYLLDLVMPHMHMALQRMLLGERDGGTREAVAGGVLSAREAEVLRWVGQGKTNPEIGSLLAISPLTVKNHVQKILRKLGVSNRAQAVSKAHMARLIGMQPRRRAPGRASRNEPAKIAEQRETK